MRAARTASRMRTRSGTPTSEVHGSGSPASMLAPALVGMPGATLTWRAWVAQFPPEARMLLDLLIEVNCRLAREKAARLQSTQVA